MSVESGIPEESVNGIPEAKPPSTSISEIEAQAKVVDRLKYSAPRVARVRSTDTHKPVDVVNATIAISVDSVVEANAIMNPHNWDYIMQGISERISEVLATLNST